MGESGDSIQQKRKGLSLKYLSPIGDAMIVLLGLFIAEIISMLILNKLRIQSYIIATLLDASIMVVITFPLIYLFPLRALLREVEKRKRGEALLTRVMENLPVGVWITDKKGKITHGNPASQLIWAGARYVGIEQYSEYKGWWVDSGKLIGPEEWAAARAIQHGETSINEEVEIECFDGTHKIILNSAIPIIEQSVIQGTIIVNQDITERKQAENALKESEALYRTAFETMPLGIWLTDSKAKIIYANPAVKKIWEGAIYAGVERYGEYKGWWVSTGELIKPEEWASYRAATTGETSLNEEIEIQCFDGTHKIIFNSAIPVRDEQGKIINVFVINQDITERKRGEQELMRTNQLLERFFLSIETLIAYFDRDFNFIRVNEAYARAGGHPAEFYIGKNHFELYPQDENRAIFQRVVETGEAYNVHEKPFEYAEYPERGVTYWDWNLQPVKGMDNTVEGLVLSLIDVTERKRAEQQLERQNQELRALSLTEQKQRELAEGLARSVIALSSSLDLEYVMDTIMEQLHRSVPFTIAAITRVEDDSVRVIRHTSLEDHPEAVKIIANEFLLNDYPMLRKITSTQQPICIEDTAQSPDWDHVPGTEWVRSYITAPLVIGGQVKGTIHLTSDQPGAFNQDTLERLMVFAAPAALAVQNAQLYAAESHARQVAEAMSAMSLALTQTLELEKVFYIILEYLPRLVAYDGAYIVTLDDEAHFKLRIVDDDPNEMNPKRAVGSMFNSWEIPHLQQVLRTKQGLLIRDTRDYPEWETLVTRGEIRCWMGIPILLRDEVMGIIGLVHTKPDAFSQEQLHLLESIAGQVSVAIQNAWLFEQVRAGQERFQLLSRRLVEVQESERSYIARELHDETGQALTAIMFGLRAIEQEVNQPDQIPARVAEVKQLTDEVLESLHRLAMNLRPASLDHLGLVSALEQLVKEVTVRYRMNVRFKSDLRLEEGRLPDHMETALYRIFQEALTNTARHAHAQNVDVILELRDGRVLAMVEDDGAGFDTEKIRERNKLGLVGMQERAEMMGGSLQIESRPGGGTTIVVEVPYDNSSIDR